LPAARQSIRQPIEQTTNTILANVDTGGLGVEGGNIKHFKVTETFTDISNLL